LDGTVNLVVNIQDVTWSINGANEYPAPTTAQTLFMGTGATHPMPLFFTVTSVAGYTNTITYSTAALTGTTGLVFVYPPVFTLGASDFYQDYQRNCNDDWYCELRGAYCCWWFCWNYWNSQLCRADCECERGHDFQSFQLLC